MPSLPSTPAVTPPEDLRQSLYQTLGEQFSQRLDAETSLPEAVKKSLSRVLQGGQPTSTAILALLAGGELEDSEVPNE